MTLNRWFRVVNWTSVLAPLWGAARKVPPRKPARPALWPELLEGRTLLSAGGLPPALLVAPGGDSQAPVAHKGQPAEADPGPAAARSTNQGEGAGGQPQGGPGQQGGPDQKGNPADSGAKGDGGNGHNGNQDRSSGAVPGNGEAVGRLSGGGQQGDQQGKQPGDQQGDQPGVSSAAFSSDQGPAGGENAPAKDSGGGDAPGTKGAAVVPSAAAGSAGSPEALAAVFAATPVLAEPVGLPANASSIDGADALVGSALGALPSGTGSGSNAGLSMGALPLANLLTGAMGQTPLSSAMLLNADLLLGGAGNSADFSQFLNDDGAFLELWDKDQLLFPDSLPKADEMQFPGGLPWEREMPVPERAPNRGGPLSPGEGSAAEEVPVLASAVGEATDSAPALPDVQEAAAEPALGATPGSGLALPSPDANQREVSLVDSTAAPAGRETDGGEDSLRPYKVALGLLPFLPAFGFTAVTLRERVQAGKRWWEELRALRRRGR